MRASLAARRSASLVPFVLAALAFGPRAAAQPASAVVTRMIDPIARLVAGDAHDYDQFGQSVALTADAIIALVGSPTDFVYVIGDTGSVHVFHRDGAAWTEVMTLSPAVRSRTLRFGWAVAATEDGSRFVVGASESRASPRDPYGAGEAFVFARAGSIWVLEAAHVAADAERGDRAGTSVAIAADGATALIGMPGDDIAFLVSRRIGRTAFSRRSES